MQHVKKHMTEVILWFSDLTQQYQHFPFASDLLLWVL